MASSIAPLIKAAQQYRDVILTRYPSVNQEDLLLMMSGIISLATTNANTRIATTVDKTVKETSVVVGPTNGLPLIAQFPMVGKESQQIISTPKLAALNNGKGDYRGAKLQFVSNTLDPVILNFNEVPGMHVNNGHLEYKNTPIAKIDYAGAGQLTIDFIHSTNPIDTTMVNSIAKAIQYNSNSFINSKQLELFVTFTKDFRINWDQSGFQVYKDLSKIFHPDTIPDSGKQVGSRWVTKDDGRTMMSVIHALTRSSSTKGAEIVKLLRVAVASNDPVEQGTCLRQIEQLCYEYSKPMFYLYSNTESATTAIPSNISAPIVIDDRIKQAAKEAALAEFGNSDPIRQLENTTVASSIAPLIKAAQQYRDIILTKYPSVNQEELLLMMSGIIAVATENAKTRITNAEQKMADAEQAAKETSIGSQSNGLSPTAAVTTVTNIIAKLHSTIEDKIRLLANAKDTKEIIIFNSAVTILKDQLSSALTKSQKQQVDQMLKKWDEKVEEAKERIIATEIFDRLFAEIANNSNKIGGINKILLDLKGNVNKVLNGKPIENEEKIRSIVKRLLESKRSILGKTKEVAETAANDCFTKHTQEFKDNTINIEQEIKKAPNIVKKLSDPNVDIEFFTKNYADALKQKLDQVRLVVRTTELHKESKETKATATNTIASDSSAQPKQPTITVAQEQHKKNTSSLQDEIEKIIEAIKRSQTIDNVIDIINTQIKDILTRMSLEEKEKYFTNQISYAITDRSIKFLNDTATSRQVFDLLPKIVEIKNSAILIPDDDVRLIATRDQQIRSKGKKTR